MAREFRVWGLFSLFSPLFVSCFEFFKGGGNGKNLQNRITLGWRKKYSEMSTLYFDFCIYLPPTPPKGTHPLPESLFQQIMEMQWSRGRCQPGSAALRAGCHIWAKITHNAPNWIKQSWRIFYSCFHPGSCSLVAFPYSCLPRIPFFELHPRTFATMHPIAPHCTPTNCLAVNYYFFKF